MIDAGRGASSDASKICLEDHTGDVEACHCIAKALKKKKKNSDISYCETKISLTISRYYNYKRIGAKLRSFGK